VTAQPPPARSARGAVTAQPPPDSPLTVRDVPFLPFRLYPLGGIPLRDEGVRFTGHERLITVQVSAPIGWPQVIAAFFPEKAGLRGKVRLYAFPVGTSASFFELPDKTPIQGYTLRITTMSGGP